MDTRLERVSQLIRDELAEIMLKDIRDPLIGFVTLTEVKVSPDLRQAKVFFSVLGDAQQIRNAIKGVRRARKHINALLAERLELRYVPRLVFVYDETAARAQRLEELLRQEAALFPSSASPIDSPEDDETDTIAETSAGEAFGNFASQCSPEENHYGLEDWEEEDEEADIDDEDEDFCEPWPDEEDET